MGQIKPSVFVGLGDIGIQIVETLAKLLFHQYPAFRDDFTFLKVHFSPVSQQENVTEDWHKSIFSILIPPGSVPKADTAGKVAQEITKTQQVVTGIHKAIDRIRPVERQYNPKNISYSSSRRVFLIGGAADWHQAANVRFLAHLLDQHLVSYGLGRVRIELILMLKDAYRFLQQEIQPSDAQIFATLRELHADFVQKNMQEPPYQLAWIFDSISSEGFNFVKTSKELLEGICQGLIVLLTHGTEEMYLPRNPVHHFSTFSYVVHGQDLAENQNKESDKTENSQSNPKTSSEFLDEYLESLDRYVQAKFPILPIKLTWPKIGIEVEEGELSENLSQQFLSIQAALKQVKEQFESHLISSDKLIEAENKLPTPLSLEQLQKIVETMGGTDPLDRQGLLYLIEQRQKDLQSCALKLEDFDLEDEKNALIYTWEIHHNAKPKRKNFFRLRRQSEGEEEFYSNWQVTYETFQEHFEQNYVLKLHQLSLQYAQKWLNYALDYFRYISGLFNATSINTETTDLPFASRKIGDDLETVWSKRSSLTLLTKRILISLSAPIGLSSLRKEVDSTDSNISRDYSKTLFYKSSLWVPINDFPETRTWIIRPTESVLWDYIPSNLHNKDSFEIRRVAATPSVLGVVTLSHDIRLDQLIYFDALSKAYQSKVEVGHSPNFNPENPFLPVFTSSINFPPTHPGRTLWARGLLAEIIFTKMGTRQYFYKSKEDAYFLADNIYVVWELLSKGQTASLLSHLINEWIKKIIKEEELKKKAVARITTLINQDENFEVTDKEQLIEWVRKMSLATA